MLKDFLSNNLISSDQCCFKPGESCINQLIASTHNFLKSLDAEFEVRGVFLDIS